MDKLWMDRHNVTERFKVSIVCESFLRGGQGGWRGVLQCSHSIQGTTHQHCHSWSCGKDRSFPLHYLYLYQTHLQHMCTCSSRIGLFSHQRSHDHEFRHVEDSFHVVCESFCQELACSVVGAIMLVVHITTCSLLLFPSHNTHSFTNLEYVQKNGQSNTDGELCQQHSVQFLLNQITVCINPDAAGRMLRFWWLSL